jgi:hypothetical protein
MKFALVLVTSGIASSLSAGCSDGRTVGFGSSGVGPGTVTVGVGGGPLDRTFDQPVVIPKDRTPAISGGTLAVIAQGHKAAVADPERDLVSIVDLDQVVLSAAIRLLKGDEPGRLVEDGHGFVHVALRGAGAVATLDPVLGTEVRRRAICGNPRGLAYDAVADTVTVACVGGELVTLPAAGGDALRVLQLDRDLRDVVVDGNRLLVSRFRAAELLVVEADGHVSNRLKPAGLTLPPNPGQPSEQHFSPAVAWRTVAAPGGGAIMTFQEEQVGQVEIQPGGYGGFCGGIVRSAVSLLRADGTGWTVPSVNVVLPVDVTPRPPLSEVTVAGAGFADPNGFRQSLPLENVMPPLNGTTTQPDPCGGDPNGPPDVEPRGQVVSVAVDAAWRLIVQTRDPMLVVGEKAVVLPGELIADTGHTLFHMATPGGLACASCHPEGHDDGRIWNFSSFGQRRTQPLAGGTLGSGPFHWSGDMRDFTMLSQEVFQSRMSGPHLRDEHVAALAGWIQKTPGYKPLPAADAAAAQRGQALFSDPRAGCVGCHSGAAMTTHAIVDVGTGQPFKIPSLLGVGFRAPFMHDGCAATLADRFGSCGGGDKHGTVSALSERERADLVAYLGTL